MGTKSGKTVALVVGDLTLRLPRFIVPFPKHFRDISMTFPSPCVSHVTPSPCDIFFARDIFKLVTFLLSFLSI